MPSFRLLTLALLPLFLRAVLADTSLFIPGFDPQPLSVANLGAGADGRTTWEIVPGSLTGTFDEPAFIGTATLVEGPVDAHLTYANAELSLTLDIHCGLNNGVAACLADQGYESTPFIFPSQPIEPFLVQGGGTASVNTPVTTAGSSTSASAAPSITPSSPSSTTSSSSSGFVTSTAAPSITPSPSASAGANTDLNPIATPSASPVANSGSSVSVSGSILIVVACVISLHGF
ncbi:hypothetical protein BV25DRAFT_1913805 [Artomyces pyxidatus]|uniref:Uncharacterized protein n=1 Tax=Artomyces pyxidatus TaxID=48021 RepID=A0ACB8T8Q5_9AGAM|nr:hypothetical protein BV25DRAFT_1913805 [Artomyces pyxidatus]